CARVAGYLERLEHYVGTMVADRAARQLDAVADDVVLVRLDREWVARLERLEAALRHRERVVTELDRARLLVALVHREVDDPAEPERVRLHEPEVFPELDAQASRDRVHGGALRAHEQDRVAGRGAGDLDEPRESCLVEELRDR